MNDEAEFIHLDGGKFGVHPAPSRDEAAAIVAALAILRRAQTPARNDTGSRWLLAARREGIRREHDVSIDGWRLAARLDR